MASLAVPATSPGHGSLLAIFLLHTLTTLSISATVRLASRSLASAFDKADSHDILLDVLLDILYCFLVMADSYKKALSDARKELLETQRRIAALEQKAFDLRQSVATLAKLCGEPSGLEEQMGLTDAIRLVLKGNRQLSAAEIIAGLRDIGFPVDEQASIDASVRTVLNRLVEAGEAGRRKRETDGRFVYYSLIMPFFGKY